MTESPIIDINLLPLTSYSGNIVLINSPSQVESIYKQLCTATVLGFDTESRPAFKKGVIRKISLLQLYDGKNAYLFRLKNMGFDQRIKSLMENPDIVKAGVAVHEDISLLSKADNFKPSGFIDLQTEAKKLNITEMSAKKLTAGLLGFRISKSQQTSNWDNSVLTKSQIAYAATDAWICYLLYFKMKEMQKG